MAEETPDKIRDKQESEDSMANKTAGDPQEPVRESMPQQEPSQDKEPEVLPAEEKVETPGAAPSQKDEKGKKTPEAEPQPEKKRGPSKEIFVLKSAKAMMTRDCMALFKALGFKVIEIRHGVNEGQTLEEQISAHPEIIFAVVMLSGDEFIYPKDKKPADARLCAPPQTLYDLGYIRARLGKKNTFALYFEQKIFKLPTNYRDTVYIPYNPSQEWVELLKNRLILCGFEINRNVKL